MRATKNKPSRNASLEPRTRRTALQRDPDTILLTQEKIATLKRTPQVQIIRRVMGLSQESFAARFQIPIGTLRDWEQGRKEPDAAARAYLTVIGRNPDAVIAALSTLRIRATETD
jgi:putative transcriptional regulator